MKKAPIIFSIFFLLFCKYSFSQTPPAIVTKSGYGNIIIRQTVMQDVLKSSNVKYKIKTNQYEIVWPTSSVAPPPNKYYISKKTGITYIVSLSDTITGIIFYPPFKGETEKGVIIGKTKTSSIVRSKEEIFQRMNKYNTFFVLRDKQLNTYRGMRYQYLEGISYGFLKNSSTIREIRIGN